MKKLPIHIKRDITLSSIDEELNSAMDNLEHTNQKIGNLLEEITGTSSEEPESSEEKNAPDSQSAQAE